MLRSFDSNQLMILTKSDIALLFQEATWYVIVVSPAKITIFSVVAKTKRSFMQMLKQVAPNTAPCWTSFSIYPKYPIELLILPHYSLMTRQLCRKLSEILLNPIFCSRYFKKLSNCVKSISTSTKIHDVGIIKSIFSF